MRFILGCLIIVSVSSGSSKPLLFASLVESLQKSTQSIEKLSRSSVMGENKHLLRHFLTRVEGTLSVGNELSEAKEVDQELISRYLSDLRKLSQTKESIDALYRQ
ncbi:MAG: hypothetical protein IE884_02185, partial [Sulfuricurvum sp.]|nr:hypothetical protein [Sulfuricurvum sp.]